MPGILRRTRVYLEFTLRPPRYFVDFLNFASDFAPDQRLSDSELSGKLASFQNGAPNSTLCSLGNFRKRKVLGTPCFPLCLFHVCRKTFLRTSQMVAEAVRAERERGYLLRSPGGLTGACGGERERLRRAWAWPEGGCRGCRV